MSAVYDADRGGRGVTPVLTIREVAALHLIATGHSVPQAARAMGASTDAVQHYLRTASVTLGTRERAHTVAAAFRHGYLTLDPIHHQVVANPYGRRPQRLWDRIETHARERTDR